MPASTAASVSTEILLVEDDAALCSVLVNTLRAAGHSVQSAANGQEALERLAGNRLVPSLIILDMNMPVMDGRKLLAVIRSGKRLSAIPVMVFTGEIPIDAASDPLVMCLTKPLDTPTFLRGVERCLLLTPP